MSMNLGMMRKKETEVGPQHTGAIGVPAGTDIAPPKEAQPVAEIGMAPRRVQEADLAELTPWLMDRLMERHPRASYEGLMSQMRHAVTDRRSFLVRTKGVVALAEAEMDPRDPRPLIRERWIRCNKVEKQGFAGKQTFVMTATLKKEAPQVQRAIIEWAKSVGAYRIIFGDDSDLPLNDRYDADSRIKNRRIDVLDFDMPNGSTEE